MLFFKALKLEWCFPAWTECRAYTLRVCLHCMIRKYSLCCEFKLRREQYFYTSKYSLINDLIKLYFPTFAIMMIALMQRSKLQPHHSNTEHDFCISLKMCLQFIYFFMFLGSRPIWHTLHSLCFKTNKSKTEQCCPLALLTINSHQVKQYTLEPN